MPYGERWRNHRRIFQQHFSPKNIDGVQSRGLEFVRKGLLPNIYQSPGDVYEHVKRYALGLSQYSPRYELTFSVMLEG